MTKEELVDVAGRCWAVWNYQPADIKAAYEAWWGMLGDLDVDEVRAMVNALTVSDSFCPKPGELRRLVLGDDAPSNAEAWHAYQQVARAVDHGTGVPDVHPLVSDVIRLVGAGLHTNGDRQFFIAEYERAVARWRREKFAP